MKATIRHVISPPIESPISLHERIVNSIAPLINLDNDDNFDPIPTRQSTSIANNSSAPSTSTANATISNAVNVSTTKNKVVFKNIQILEIHPTQPLVCYVDGGGSTSTSTSITSSILRQRIIIQNHITNEIIEITPISDVAKKYMQQQQQQQQQQEDRISKKEIEKMCLNLGLIKSIQFMDSHVLLRHSGRQQQQNQQQHTNLLNSFLPYLIIHFNNRILLYPSNATSYTGGGKANNFNSSLSSTTTYNKEPCTIIEINQSTLNKSNITSKLVLPILYTNIIAIGCSDGAVRFYSRIEQKVVKSVRGPNGKTDPVVGILSINSWDWSSMEQCHHYHHHQNQTSCRNYDEMYSYNDTSSHSPSSSSRTNSANTTRIMTICASGTAYLWELQITFDDLTQHVQKFKLRPPVVTLDVWSSLSNAISNSHNNLSGSNIVGGGSSNSSITQQKHKDCDNVYYDIDKRLLYWSIHPTHSGLSKSFVVVWDMAPDQITKTQQNPKTAGGAGAGAGGKPSLNHNDPQQLPTTPFHYHSSVIQIQNSSDYILSNSTFISGYVHPMYPNTAYAAVATSKDGSLSIIVSQCQRSNKATSSRRVNELARAYDHFTMTSMKRSADEKVLGYLRLIDESKLKVSKIIASHSRPDVFVMATNIGLIVMNLNDDILVTGSIHSCFTSAKTNTSGYIGVGDNILMVEGSSVYKAKLDFSPTAIMPNPIGILDCKDMVLFYKSPKALDKSVEFQTRSVRIPPRLLPSPSGNFLCLFWHAENRYEIVHNSSITNAARKSNRDEGPEYTPAVDTGSNVLSFAWVGDEDVFALLHPPELIKTDTSNSSSKSLKKQRITPKVGEEGEDENALIDPSKYKPSVELKVLVGVNKDAVELNLSVAPATARVLGTLPLRGRHSPTCLFGGPVLCVGSLLQDKESSRMDGLAYFYSRRMNSEENDQSASSYVSVGPALPYPDLVVWDDDGKILAVIVGRRIAIYLADAPNFTLLSTTYLGTAGETDAKVQSAKFVHGILYCSTQSSIQCIMLGNIENDEIICEAQSFTMLSTMSSLHSTQSSIQPIPQPMQLIKPSILGYLHGSLLVSSIHGVHAISLSHPIIRIGALLATGHHTRAQRWFDAFHPCHHEALAQFLDRRGFPEMALQLSGLPLESIVNYSLIYGLTEHLENALEVHGVEAFHMIDTGRGANGDCSQSIVVCVGTYLLRYRKGDLVLQMANECLSFGEAGRKEAFMLGILLLNLYPSDARQLIGRAITEHAPRSKPLSETWRVAFYVNECILKSQIINES